MPEYASGGFGAKIENAEITDATIALTKLAARTQGDIIYFGAAGAAAGLAAGSAGQVLKTNGAGANPSWTDAGDIVLLGSDTLAGAATSLEVSGLTTTDFKFIKIAFVVTRATANDDNILINFNSDTGANYSYNGILNDGAPSAATAQGGIKTGTSLSGNPLFCEAIIANTATLLKSVVGRLDGQDALNRFSGSWSNTSDLISAVTISKANNFAIGSRLYVWGLK